MRFLLFFSLIFCAKAFLNKTIILRLKNNKPIYLDKKFLGFTIDSEILRMPEKQFIFESEIFFNLLNSLGPSFLRMGGTDGDNTIFDKSDISDITCNSVEKSCQNRMLSDFEHTIKLTRKVWDKIQNFLMLLTDWDFIFGLNAMIRSNDGSWNPYNALNLLKYSASKNYHFHLELGNEPGEYIDVFNKWVSPSQLARDFFHLKKIVHNMTNFKKKLIIGPDLDRINNTAKDLGYLNDFLKALYNLQKDHMIIDRISWHHYYASGPKAKLEEFINSTLLDTLIPKIQAVREVVNKSPLSTTPIWLGEGSNTWSSGTPNISDSYVAGFMFLDKLGQCALNDVKVFIRQSLFVGNYAMIGPDLSPNPDYWTAVLFKKLLSHKVIPLGGCDEVSPSGVTGEESVRVYAHCSKDYQGGITFYILNLNNRTIHISFGSQRNELDINSATFGVDLGDRLELYLLTPIPFVADYMARQDLVSKNVFLNGHILKTSKDGKFSKLEPHIIKRANGSTVNIDVIIPAYTYGFYVYPLASLKICHLN